MSDTEKDRARAERVRSRRSSRERRRVILYSTMLHTWEVWSNGRPEGHGTLASCQAHAPDADVPTPQQFRLRDGDPDAPTE